MNANAHHMTNPPGRRERGAITLFVTLFLLVTATLVTLFTNRALVFEQRVNANEYRFQQAFSAAKAAVDEAFAYYDAVGGATALGDTSATLWGTLQYALPGTLLCAQWRLLDCRTSLSAECISAGVTAPTAGAVVHAIGFSDDYNQNGSCNPGTFTDYAQHTIVQHLRGAQAVAGSPRQPLIARGVVGITGDFNIVNAYWNATVWAGRSVSIGESVSARTYVDDPTDDASPDSITTEVFQHLDSDPRIALASGHTLGNNIDIIESDPGLRNLDEEGFFRNFFWENKSTVASWAAGAGQRFDADDSPDLDGLSGYIWVDVDDGDSFSLNGGNIGTHDNPAVVVVDGDLNTMGNIHIIGLLYCAGNWDAGGTLTVEGTVMVGGTDVGGSGGVNLLYRPSAIYPGNPPAGAAAAVPYSWRDF